MKLDELGITDNTTAMYPTDNGAKKSHPGLMREQRHLHGEKGNYGKGDFVCLASAGLG
jgi:arylsulfatase A-like enzyme